MNYVRTRFKMLSEANEENVPSRIWTYGEAHFAEVQQCSVLKTGSRSRGLRSGGAIL